MRCTQIIGLNNYAKNYLQKHQLVEIENSSSFGYSDPFDEDTVYRFSVFYDHHKKMKLYEKEEVAPWNSGPDVYTFLIYENGEVVEESKWVQLNDSGQYQLVIDNRCIVSSEIPMSSWTLENGEWFTDRINHTQPSLI